MDWWVVVIVVVAVGYGILSWWAKGSTDTRPVTDRQLAFLADLRNELELPLEDDSDLTIPKASEEIQRLLDLKQERRGAR